MKNETVKEKKSFNKKKLKYGTVATVITVVFVAVVVFINLIAGILTDRENLKLDLTSQKYYEVSQDTIDYIRNIKKDVVIDVMYEESRFENSTYMKMVYETLNKYEQNSDHIEVDFHDITAEPDVINKYSDVYSGTISEGSIVVACGDRVKVISSLDNLFTIDSSSYYYTGSSSITGYKGEQELTSAIMSVTDANPKKAAVIDKYNGSSIYHVYNSNAVTSIANLLDKNGYEVTKIDILSDGLSPDDYDLVVLPAPVNDLTEDCITKLDDFLYNNGNLDKNMIYIADIFQYKTPNIDAFLEIWGIEVGGNVVYESNADKNQKITISTGNAEAPIVNSVDDEYTQDLSNTKLPIVAPISRNINLLFDSNVDRTTSSLLQTSDTAYLYPLNMKSLDEAKAEAEAEENQETEEATEETTEFNPDEAEKSAQNVMALATKTNTVNNEVHTNNLLVIGGISMVDPNLTSSSTYNNAEFVINAINKICGKENGIIIAEKSLSQTTIDITASQVSAINKVVIYIIPIIVILAGIIVYLWRRNR
ncbi:Gldg family protein [Porcipelethomonas sp.]|uniref:Gldg family protein n=1 Tax=Porcipelethomonas sp. TaxID=2981675 RepID=UPI003EF592D4